MAKPVTVALKVDIDTTELDKTVERLRPIIDAMAEIGRAYDRLNGALREIAAVRDRDGDKGEDHA